MCRLNSVREILPIESAKIHWKKGQFDNRSPILGEIVSIKISRNNWHNMQSSKE